MDDSQITCPECGAEIPYSPTAGMQVLTCPGCKNELEIESDAGQSADRVGAGVKSFERPQLTDEPGSENLSMRQRVKLETGGIGDLIFNPMSGQLAAMNGLGRVGCVISALVILAIYVVTVWFSVFKFKAVALELSFGEIISYVPLSGHAGFVVALLILPAPLFFVFLLFSVSGSARGGVPQILLTSAIVLAPVVIVTTTISLIALFPNAAAFVFLPIIELFKFGSDTPGFGFLEWMIIIGFLSFLSIAEVHPMLLIYGSLTQVIGTTPRTAFFVTPIVPVLHLVLLYVFSNTLARQSFFDMSEFVEIMLS